MISTLTRSGSNLLPQSLPFGKSTDTVKIKRAPIKVYITVRISGKSVSTLERIAPGQSTPANMPIEIVSSPKARLRANWSKTITEAKALRENTPNPVQSLVQLFESLPGDYSTWREIIEEPYG